MKSNPRELAATVREALSEATFPSTGRSPRHAALAALDALVAECERLDKKLHAVSNSYASWQVESKAALEEMRRERDALARAGAGRDDLAREVAVQYDRAEAAERERDANMADALRWAETAQHLEACARRYEEALRRVVHELDQWVYADGSAVYRVGRAEKIARATLAEEEK